MSRSGCRRKPEPADRGFALLIVLWTLGLLSLLGAQLTGAARSQTRQAANLRANAVAEAAADGAAQEAVLRLLRHEWTADDRVHAVRLGGALVRVRVENLAGRINPNTTTPLVMQGLLAGLGLDPAHAAALGKAIIDWRTVSTFSLSGGSKLAQYQAAGLPYGPSNRAFESIDEIGLVAGMTPELLHRMRPYLSVYQEGDVARDAAGAAGTQALDDARLAGGRNSLAAGVFGFTSPNLVALVIASAQVGSGTGAARFTRQSVVRLKAEPEADEAPYQILTWETPAE